MQHMTPAQQQAASLAWQHNHPLFMSVVPSIFIISVIMAIIVVRWYFSREAWPFHPGGRQGFFKDEFLRLGAIFIPYAVLMIGARYFIYDLHPELLKSPYLWVGLLSIFIFRRLAGFIPFVRAAGKRIDAARKMAKEAKFSA